MAPLSQREQEMMMADVNPISRPAAVTTAQMAVVILVL